MHLILNLIFLLTAAAQDCGDGAPCPAVPVPSHCAPENIKMARAQAAFLKAAAKEQFDGRFESVQKEIASYIEFLSFAQRCESPGKSLACKGLDSEFAFGLAQSLGHGWSKEYQLSITAKGKGDCAVDKAATMSSYNLRSGQRHSVLSMSAGKKDRGFIPAVSYPCKVREGEEIITSRGLAISDTGLTAIDWTPGEMGLPTSAHLGQRVAILAPRPVQLIPLGRGRMRLQWSGEVTSTSEDFAYVDYAADGLLIGSNFLAPSTWSLDGCTTLRKDKKFIPQVILKESQTLAK